MRPETEKAYIASIEVQWLEGTILLECDSEITIQRKDSTGLVHVEVIYTLIR